MTMRGFMARLLSAAWLIAAFRSSNVPTDVGDYIGAVQEIVSHDAHSTAVASICHGINFPMSPTWSSSPVPALIGHASHYLQIASSRRYVSAGRRKRDGQFPDEMPADWPFARLLLLFRDAIADAPHTSR